MLGANFKSVPNAEIPRHPDQVFTVIATTERMGSSVAALTCAYNPHTCVPLHLLSYDLCDVSTAMSEQWIDKTVWETRRWSDFLIGRHAPTLRVEEGSFGRGLMATAEGPILAQFEQGATVVDFEIIERKHLERWPRLEHRTDEIRSAVNSGLFVRLTEYASQLSITHRTTTNNFLLQQLLGYRPDDRDQAQGLVAALAVAVLITRPPY